jgi:hypothetical protein
VPASDGAQHRQLKRYHPASEALRNRTARWHGVVPDLTRSAGIKHNKSLSLRRREDRLGWFSDISGTTVAKTSVEHIQQPAILSQRTQWKNHLRTRPSINVRHAMAPDFKRSRSQCSRAAKSILPRAKNAVVGGA